MRGYEDFYTPLKKGKPLDFYYRFYIYFNHIEEPLLIGIELSQWFAWRLDRRTQSDAAYRAFLDLGDSGR